MRVPLIIGHRGFAARFPDNSVDGVRAALDVGADGVEVDIRRSASRSWVCHHNRSRGGRPIRDWADDALRRDGVPALVELATVVPVDRHLFIEVKPLAERDLMDGIGALAALLRARSSRSRVISSSPAVLRCVARAIPGAAVSLVFDKVPERVPEGVELSPSHKLVERLLSIGVVLHPWTVNRPGRMRELARLGVASITTNDPELAVEVLRGRG
jgi:glycerophosphoryl diester phosphodiesterase